MARTLRRPALLLALTLAVAVGCRPAPAASASPTPISNFDCPILPDNNIWNTPIEDLPVDPRSDDYVASIGAASPLHADFGASKWEGFDIGIPYTLVPVNQPKVAVSFEYDDESDPPNASPKLYPIPPNAKVEGDPNGDGDRHILLLQQGSCTLYEIYAAQRNPNGSWSAGSGAIFDLRSNALRPNGWTSADAAGLPILPGLVRYEEVAAGEIRHAIRFTAPETQRAYVWPARHYASDDTSPELPPMGQRFRLRADFDISGFGPQSQIILRALKKYGMILADNGSSWYLTGAPNPGWDDDDLHDLQDDELITGADFEAVDHRVLQVDPDSGEAHQSSLSITPTSASQGQLITIVIKLVAGVSATSLTSSLPAELSYAGGSLSTEPPSVPDASYAGGVISWSRPASSAPSLVTISYQATLSSAARQAISTSALLSRAPGQLTLSASLLANPLKLFLPALRR